MDDASTDTTPDVLSRCRHENLIALCLDQPAGSYAARNRGWREARGRIIAFTDDDCLPQPDWLSALDRAFQAADVVGVQGKTLPIPGTITPFTHQIEQLRPGPPYRTCNIAYRREALERLGGFDDSLRWYSDNILGLRMSELGSIAFAEDAVVHHPPRPRDWRDRYAWLARFHADAAHRQVLYRYTAEPEISGGMLPMILWVIRPLLKQSSAHFRFLLHHPTQYLQGIRPMLREKRAMLLAMQDYRRERRMQPAAASSLPPLPDKPIVSVIVVTRDRPHLLAGLMEALQKQTWQQHEVIVVDHEAASEHHLTTTHNSRLATRDPKLKAHGSWLIAPSPALGAARQAGFEAAHGDIIAFTDDDCLPRPEWLQALVTAFRRQPDLWGVQGRTEAETGPIGFHTIRVLGPDPLYQTCNIAYRRDAMERAGGFDQRFEGYFEDTALGARILDHGPIGFDSNAIVTHRAIPRLPRDRTAWSRVLRDERLLARTYPHFYHRTRGPGFALAVITHWLLGSPLKALLRELPRARHDSIGYLRFACLLFGERVALIRALMEGLTTRNPPS